MADSNDPEVLDYAPPPPPLERRDSMEYYREPPALSEWGIGMIVSWLLAFIVVTLGVFWLFGRWFNAAFQ
jgi:hypothetical protein